MPSSQRTIFFSYLFTLFISWINVSCDTNATDQQMIEFEKKRANKIYQDSVKKVEEYERLRAYKNKEIDTNLLTEQNVERKLRAYGNLNPENRIKIITEFGDIEILLYEDTPLHRANFIHLIKRHYFDSTLFYRVIDQFMIQGGNSDRDLISVKMKNIGFYTVPDEIHPHHIHKKGALAMAVKEQLDVPKKDRHKRSSAFNFYIIQKDPISERYLDQIEAQFDIDISQKRRSIYKKYGGTPHLDNNYTVFGEVTKGLAIVDKIAKVKIEENDRPLKDIFLSIEIIE